MNDTCRMMSPSFSLPTRLKFDVRNSDGRKRLKKTINSPELFIYSAPLQTSSQLYLVDNDSTDSPFRAIKQLWEVRGV
jgi:hypothetical protein